jgi:membrane protein DedA with SNARE-associated domain
VPFVPAQDVGQCVVGSLGPLTVPSAATSSAVLASIGTWLEHFHGPAAYVVCGLLVFGEASVLLGFVIPGETAALVGGALASFGHANLELMVVVVVGCAIAGDSVGYEVGKLIGPWLLERRPLRGHPGIRRGEDLLARYGGPAVFLGRWVALARALVPGLSGMSGMRYRTFLFFNAVGGVVWGTTYVMIGYGAGTSYGAVARTAGIYSLVILALVVMGVVAYVLVRRRRSQRRWGRDGPDDEGGDPRGT